ncbi:hypothetical protein JH06_3201 [Blastocystis sp. subtype 4]|uniref:hypothetical protein n=1 Tax=Blastocystis sp. subtype 4 TaxID=944170 RepID=UPI00071220F7|nr:hypothetical protein JH06_3201 [Blastocystis sp. subtype 4]KNB42980.1 hypothetical protein JH06_3201 [Blastocystis sp. subtype 4]|eukprot:XP_014526423.1 hypothetical protein JH06_3201 [Blastocystis sp. subtype 4]
MMNLDMNADTRKQRVYWTMYLKRIFSLRQMDLDYSFSQMIQICISPTKVYKMTAWRKQTKNQWARDDPSFILITLFFVASISAAYSIAIRPGCVTCLMYTKSLIQSVFFSLLAGLVIATISCYWINHSMRIQRPHSPEQFVEWLYALDIHFNAFFPALLIMGVLQYVILPFIVRAQFMSTFVADIACIAAICYYCYITFLGYMCKRGRK